MEIVEGDDYYDYDGCLFLYRCWDVQLKCDWIDNNQYIYVIIASYHWWFERGGYYPGLLWVVTILSIGFRDANKIIIQRTLDLIKLCLFHHQALAFRNTISFREIRIPWYFR